MEVRSDPAIMSSRDSFSISVEKSPASSPKAVAQSMRMPYPSEGTAVFRPVSGVSASSSASFQVGGAELPAAQNLAVNPGETVKRKRGRPRKYAADGKMALGKSAAPLSSFASTGFSLSYTSSSTPRPRGSPSSLLLEQLKKAKSKKLQMAAIGAGGIGFTPHVITVKAGEDVSSKIMSFSHHGPRAVCILSANGAISNVTLRQASTSGGTVTYEGRFELLSLSGSFLLSESDGQRSRTGGLSVSLAGPDGRVLGGGVAGLLTAASPVQVVVGSFIADGGKKEPELTSSIDAAPIKSAPVGVAGPSSPASRGTLSESSGGGPASPTNQSTNGNNNQPSLANTPWK